MANCPKCGRHLRLADWRQTCPGCGANVFLYDLQERLMQDADKAEVQHFYFQKKVDRAKASYIGSKAAVARIVFSFVPPLAVFLPLLVKASGSGGLPDTVDAVKLYTFFSEGDPGAFLSAAAGDPQGRLLLAAFGCLAAGLVLWLLHFALLFLSCSPHGKVRNITLSVLLLASVLGFTGLVLALPAGTFTGASPGAGAYVYVLLCVLNLAVEIAVFRQGIEIKHKQCYVGAIPIEEYFEMVDRGTPHEEIRAEQYRRLTAQQQERERELNEAAGKAAAEKEAETNG